MNRENNSIGELNAFSDWKTPENHKGFDIVANRFLEYIYDYIKYDVKKYSKDVSFFITSHCRGAAIANILSAYLIDNGCETFTYTFASPNTTTKDSSSDSKYNSIFNIVNDDDFVPMLPMNKWNFSRYGLTASDSIADKYEKEWESMIDGKDYNPDTFGLDETIKAICEVGKDAEGNYSRNNCYIFTCNCHGDGTFKDDTTITNYGISENSRDEAKNKIPNNALPYCIIEDTGIIRYNFTVCQTPAYFMQLLAATSTGEISGVTFLISLNIADRYENAKTQLIQSKLGGIEHPHYLQSYYILSTHLSANDFN